jgi:hypothetical protein
VTCTLRDQIHAILDGGISCGACGTPDWYTGQIMAVVEQQAADDLALWRSAAYQHARERDGAYRERAQLVALLAALYPAVLAPAADVDEPGWQILYLTLPTGQASWHIHPRDADLYGHVQQVPSDDERAQWDGHTTEEKYQRIADHVTEHVEADRYWAMINAPLTEQQVDTLAADLRAGRVKRRKGRLLADDEAAGPATRAGES